ncbi:MAG: GNAT family N-acetyltransferase [Actinomycetota bacterium]
MTGPRAAVTGERWDHRRTDRLVLDHVHVTDVDDWHRIHADPRVWTHFPSGRHTSRDVSAQFVSGSIADWDATGLGYWSIREVSDGPVIGCGGCRLVPDRGRWNLYYRFAPEVQGRGYGTELARTAVAAAHDVEPALPVTAYMLEHNAASWRVAERIGLVRTWVGPDEGNPDPEAVSFLYADRPGVTI